MSEQTGSGKPYGTMWHYEFDLPPQSADTRHSERDREVAVCQALCPKPGARFTVWHVENLTTIRRSVYEIVVLRICRTHRTARIPGPGIWESLDERSRHTLRHACAKEGLRLIYRQTDYDQHCALACAHWEHRETGIHTAEGHTVTLVFRMCDRHGRAHLQTDGAGLWESLDPVTQSALRYRLRRDGYHIVAP